jgi:FkbM family methyltransferase
MLTLRSTLRSSVFDLVQLHGSVMKYYSQYSQDRFMISRVFRGLRGGVFLDIGANDGMTYSNTLALEESLGWTGLAIEPHPVAFSKLQTKRKCDAVNCALSDQELDLDFLMITGYSEMLSGIASQYSAEHRARIEAEVKAFGGSVSNIKVPGRTLSSVLSEAGITKVNYCSIDIEGGEQSVLRSWPFDLCVPDAFSIENNYRDREIREFVASRNYQLVTRLRHDDVFVLKTSPYFREFKWFERLVNGFGYSL